MRSAEGLSPHRELSPRSDWRLCRNKGLHPLRRFAAIPAHPQKQYTRRWRLYCFCGFYYPIREVIPIAIYHWNIGIVSRGKGKSAVAAAAYRSGEKLTNEWDGMTHDYTRKGGVVCQGINGFAYDSKEQFPAFLEVMVSTDLRHRMGVAAGRLARQRFSEDGFAANALAVYRSCLNAAAVAAA